MISSLFTPSAKRMEEGSRLQKEISDLVNILSFITKRDPGSEEKNSEPELVCSEDDRINLSLDEDCVDEAEFEAPVTSRGADLDVIKRNASDRLAEVLARFKRSKGNLDAKHVTSVIVVEALDAKSITFLCAKNEGLDGIDLDFLRKLENLLWKVTRVGEEQTAQLDQIFDTMFDHQGPRVKHYTTVLRKAIKSADLNAALPKTLTSRNVKEGLSPATFMDWEDDNGLHFKFQIGEEGEKLISDKAVDCLSDQEEENLVQEVYSEIQRLFGNTSHGFLPIHTKNLLKRVYHIVRHPRQRPALKGLLRQAFDNGNQLFKPAWDSVLYLTRIFYAAVTFVDLATRLGSVSIKFEQVPVAVADSPRIPDRKSPNEVLESLGHSSLSQMWRDIFQIPKKTEEFDRLSGLRKTVHGEVQLIFHVELMHSREQLDGKVLPYIGCSKKCCFFCDLFRKQHGTFQARGTHETLFPLWALPKLFPQQSLQVLLRFTEVLRELLRKILDKPYPPPRRDLLRQSSAALSTVKAVQRETPTYSTRPQTVSKLMLGLGGVGATEHQVEFLPSPEAPGYATLMGGLKTQQGTLVPIGEAEMAKINHERRTSMLELIGEMPGTRFLDQKPCRGCRRAAEYRCSACWTWYCSKACQRRNWAIHVFVCRVPNRPSDVDFLRLAIKGFMKYINSGGEAQLEERVQNAFLYLLADDHLCKTFGFNSCKNRLDVLNLACLYSTMLSRIRSPVISLQEELETGNLSNFMGRFCQLERSIAQITNKEECDCVTWFLSRQSSELLLIPNVDKATYDIWDVAVARTIESLDLAHKFNNRYRPNSSQADVVSLYVVIQPTVWLLPDIYSSAWVKFGFCHCRSFSQRAELARSYLALASSDATFDDIVSAYETSSLSDLMYTHGIDVSGLEKSGIRLHRPGECEYSVYRLMIGVHHALSGRFCTCFHMLGESRQCHAYFETHLDHESDTHFGFHLTNSWERWQLLNFYNYLFQAPDFDPRRMAEATEDSDPSSLENYLETLVPDMRRKLYDRHRANLFFPRLGNRLGAKTLDGRTVSHFHLQCECKVHDVTGPPGIPPINVEFVLT